MEREIVGIAASVFILLSLTFKCVTIQRNILMRSLNIVGSLLFVIYGALMTPVAWSMVVCNGLLVFFNVYHIARLSMELKKSKKQPDEASQNTEEDSKKPDETPTEE